jgi:hypothetical protein
MIANAEGLGAYLSIDMALHTHRTCRYTEPPEVVHICATWAASIDIVSALHIDD